MIERCGIHQSREHNRPANEPSCTSALQARAFARADASGQLDAYASAVADAINSAGSDRDTVVQVRGHAVCLMVDSDSVDFCVCAVAASHVA